MQNNDSTTEINEKFRAQIYDRIFEDKIGYCKDRLIVFYKKAYQMIDCGDKYEFKELKRYDLNNISENRKRRKHFSIRKSDIVKVEICGKINNFFMMDGADLIFYINKGKKQKKMEFRLFGRVNRFEIKNYLSSTENIHIEFVERKDERVSNFSLLDSEELTLRSSLLAYYNKKRSLIMKIITLLAVISVILAFVGSSFETEPGNIIKGIGALLIFVCYLIYIKYNDCVFFIFPQTKVVSKYERLRTDCFGVIMIPTIFVMFAEINNYGSIVDFTLYAVISITVAVVMLLLFVILAHEHRKKIHLLFACALLCVICAFVEVCSVNSMYCIETMDTYQTTVLDKRESASAYNNIYFYSVKLSNGRVREISVKEDEYQSIVKGKTKAAVKECRGLLGIVWAEIELEN